MSNIDSTHSIDFICRTHELVMAGLQRYFEKGGVADFAAPNYCDIRGNIAAILEVDEQAQSDFTIFEATFLRGKD